MSLAEPLEVGRGLLMVSRASRQDTELDTEMRGVSTSWDPGAVPGSKGTKTNPCIPSVHWEGGSDKDQKLTRTHQ